MAKNRKRYSKPKLTKTESEYNRLKKNVQSKMNRIKKLNPYVTTTIKQDGKEKVVDVAVNDLIKIPKFSDFKSRKEFNTWKKQAESFTNRNNRHFQFKQNKFGKVASHTAIKEISTQRNEIIKRANDKIKEMSDLPTFSRGKKQPETLGNVMAKMGKHENPTGIDVPEPFDFNKVHHQSLQEIAEKNQNKLQPDYYNKRQVQMKQNFINMLRKIYNSDSDDAIKMIKSINADVFYDIYRQNLSDLEFRYFYTDSDDDEVAMEDLRITEAVLQSYFDGEINNDLKDFPNG
jgi:hypothetical protein